MNYDEWNACIADCFTRRAGASSLVYLNAEDSLIENLGERGGVDVQAALPCFRDEVRGQVWVGGHDEIRVEALRTHDREGRPRGVAFLALMVLAANHMGDHELSEINYFTQFRKLLRLNEEHRGRPPGIIGGREARLWEDWGRYVQQQGLLSSARPGAGPTRYIQYPLSQTMLRFTDQQRLRELFAGSAYFRTYREPDLLMARIVALRDQLPKRLQEKLRATGEQYVALTEAVADLHQEFLAAREAEATHADVRAPRASSAVLTADVMRAPGGFRRPPLYQLLPRWRTELQQGVDEPCPEVEIGGEWLPLEANPERPEHALPLGSLTPEQLAQGAHFATRHAGRYTELVLPERPFRVLVMDPDRPDGGVYASGRLPSPDTHFVFLGPGPVIEDLRRLREMGKVDWESERPLNGTGWFEVNGAMIIDREWGHLRLGDVELFNGLRPRRMLTIGLSGGLRAQEGFLVGVAPVLTIYGTSPAVPLRVFEITEAEEAEVWEGEISPREPKPLPRRVVDNPGLYRIDIGPEREPERRLLRMVDWEALRHTQLPDAAAPTARDPLARAVWRPGS